MSEEREDKGFKVVDRRSMSDEEREADRKPAAPAAPPEAAAGAPGGAPAAGGTAEAQAGTGAGGHPHGGEVGPPGFLDLVHSLQFSAMLHLGMIQGQDGRRSPVDLPAAQDAIDMLGVLKEKTKGNLTEEEDGVLTEGLYALRMGYLAAMEAGKPQGGGTK